MTSTATPAALYCRISQDRTGQEAGVTRQEADGRKLAAERGWDVLDVLTDNDLSAFSGKTRPGYDRLVAGVRSGRYRAVIAWHPDRLYRRPIDLEHLVPLLNDTGVEVATVRSGRVDLSTASGRFQARMLGSAAAYESELKGERVQAAAEARARAGRFSGGVRPYGYEADGMTVRESEAAHVRAVAADLLAGVSLREAVRRRVAEGAVTSTGKPLRAQHFRLMILAPRVAGLSSHRGVVVGEAAWPAILPEDQWRQVKAILEDPKRRTSPGNVPKHLLSGIAVCGLDGCGLPCRVSVAGGSRRSPERRYSYRCPRGHVIRSKPALEAYVVAGTMQLLEQLGVSALVPTPAGSQSAHADAEALRRRLDALAEDYADGTLSREQLKAGTARTRERLAAVEATIAATQTASALSQLQGRPPREAWADLTLVRQRAVLAEMWTVVLHPMPAGHRGVNDQGVQLVSRLHRAAPTG